MSDSFDSLAAMIRSMSDEYCENQMYLWDGFDPMDPNPKAFFRKCKIEFDGELFIRYPVKRTFDPIPQTELAHQENFLGIELPTDYKQLLLEFGQVHLPGKAKIIIESPEQALKTTRRGWCGEGQPLSALAISRYNMWSDGNSIGFLRYGDKFQSAVYEFDHELRYKGDDPSLWSKQVGESLAEFLLGYLSRRI